MTRLEDFAFQTRDAHARRTLAHSAREHHVRGRVEAGGAIAWPPVPGPGRDGERVSESPAERHARVVRRLSRRLAQTRLHDPPRDADGKRVRGVDRRLRLSRLEPDAVVLEGRKIVGFGVGRRRRVAPALVVVFGFASVDGDLGKRREVGGRELEPRGRVRPLARVHAPATRGERHRGARGAEPQRGRCRRIGAWPARRRDLGVGVRAQRPDDATGPAERYRRVRVFTHGRARVRSSHRDSRRRSGIVASTRDPGWRCMRRAAVVMSLEC